MKRLYKALALSFALVLLCAAFIPAILAAPAENPMRNSYVIDDLNTMNVNFSKYPKDTSDKGAYVISFLEYGYSAKKDFRYYDLYLYLYVPRGVNINDSNNFLQMSYQKFDGSTSSELKYPIEIMSRSLDAENKYIFYKLKVSVGALMPRNLNPNTRVYNLTSVELNFSDTGVEDIPLEQKYTYRGYQKYFGNTDDRDDLYCERDKIEVCRVNIGTGSWFSNSSKLGEDYRWEVSSVYFAIPNYFINEYGDINSDTSGLVKVEGVYDKYGANGLIVPDGTWYDRFQSLTGKSLDSIRTGPSFSLKDKTILEAGPIVGAYSTIIKHHFSYNLLLNSFVGGFLYTTYSSDHQLTKLCLLSQGTSSNISTEDLLSLYNSYNRPKLLHSEDMYIGSHLTNIGQVQYPYVVNVDGDLSSAIETYASRKEWGSLNWLHKLFNKELYDDEEGYSDCKQLVELNGLDFSDSVLESEYVGSELYLQWSDYLKLKEYYNSNSVGNHVYLMRFDVNPYYCAAVDLGESYDDRDGGNGYYYEKVIYENFDILRFTFRDKSGSEVTVPVSSKPVDLIGSIVSGSNKDDNNPNNFPFDDSISGIINDAKELLSSMNDFTLLVVIVLGIIVFVVVGSLLFNWLSPVVGPFLTWLVGVVGTVFGWFGSIIGGIGRFIGKAAVFCWNSVISFVNIFLPFDIPTSGGSSGRDMYSVNQDRLENSRKDKELALKMAADKRSEYPSKIERRKERERVKKEKETQKSKPSYGDSDEFFQASLARSFDEMSKDLDNQKK